MGSVLVNAATPEFDRRLVAVGFLGMAIDLIVFQALFALGATVEASQIASFFAGAIVIHQRNAHRVVAQPELIGAPIQRIFNGRFFLVSIAALLLRSAVLILLIENWQWRPQTATPELDERGNRLGRDLDRHGCFSCRHRFVCIA